MTTRAKIVFNYEDIDSELSLEEVVTLITTGNRDSPEYGLTLMVLRNILDDPENFTSEKMYALYMRNREDISKASFYRIVKRLKNRGLILFDKKGKRYMPAILFSNTLQKLAMAWERIVLKNSE
ncbi:MAG: hypothetical protein GF308_06410 [Candidatus Heimdallarchaeota archaeon]|nr:hypothetical protein [Candidatus Heimdallarchaeota archaeon]